MKYCIANWKMNMNYDLTVNYFSRLYSLLQNSQNKSDSPKDVEMVVCPPYTLIDLLSRIIKKHPNQNKLFIGCQDINPNSDGAYTGEISIDMIKDFKVSHFAVGPNQVDFPAQEEKILSFWREEDVFRRRENIKLEIPTKNKVKETKLYT